MEYKYDFDDTVTLKNEINLYSVDEETGSEVSKCLPVGAVGKIEGMGVSSVYGFRPMYDVSFQVGEDEVDVTFFQTDMEHNCRVERVEAVE